MKKILSLSTIAALTALAATGVRAEVASDSVDATAGLQPALELSCTDVSFGVWRVPVRSGGGTTTITLDRDANTAAESGNTTRVAKSESDISWAHSRGTCTLSGSTAAVETAVDISISGNEEMAFAGAAAQATGYANLNAPATAATLTATLNAPTSVTIQNDGTASFYVGGVLTIPATIVADNYGGYKTTAPATISVDDGE